MAKRVLSRRQAVVGLASAVAPMLWLPACRGKREAAAAPPPVVPSRGSEASIVQRIASVGAIDGDGATVQRVFPTPGLRNLDPFVLLDDFDVRVPAGFPEHPHRGFEAFTYMIEGAFHHRDNLGNDSRIAAGGTQRFNSGRGARHSEMPGTRGSNRGLQLWVNLPRASKTMAPEYQGVAGDAMPVDEADGLRIHTVVGASSPVALHTEVEYLDVTLLADGRFSRMIPAGYSTLLYVLDDAVSIGDEVVGRGHGVVLGEGELEARGRPGARFAWLRGRPHHEPIRHRGPFVD
ncbi:MAG: pirin family protein [Deltaproteobacteria bacterium]|nr:pirin family protein [Deltaproteobacteria bacterium]